MNFQIALLLGQDGLTNGAIYALLALSIVLVFTVTRVLLVPQGEFVTFGAMTMATLQSGNTLRVCWLLLALACLVLLQRLWRRRSAGERFSPADLLPPVYGLAMLAIGRHGPTSAWPMALQVLFSLALIVPMGPWLYDLFFKPIAAAHGLVLLIVSIALHGVLVGLALWMFGPEGAQTAAFSDDGLELAGLRINAQTLWVLGVTLALIVALAVFFERSLQGKALRATAVNRLGAELMGISPTMAGRLCFGLAAFIGALSGILIAPLTTLYYDSGFLISLKGFVGAVIGGLASFPVGACGALAIGLIEAFSTFWASNYKEVIVFTLILPVLLWRSLNSRDHEEDRA
jgi:branched-chain amino acid transport system permease protein